MYKTLSFDSASTAILSVPRSQCIASQHCSSMGGPKSGSGAGVMQKGGNKGVTPHEDDGGSDSEPEKSSESGEDVPFFGADADEQGSDDFGEPVQSLFGPQIFPSAAAFWEHAAKEHGLCLATLRSQIGVDVWNDYHRIRLVNFLRKMGPEQACIAATTLGPASEIWSDDSLLQPVLEDDGLLFEDDGLEDGPDGVLENSSTPVCNVGAVTGDTAAGDAPHDSSDEVAALRQEVSRLHDELRKVRQLLTEAGPLEENVSSYVKDSTTCGEVPGNSKETPHRPDHPQRGDEGVAVLRSRARLFAQDAQFAGVLRMAGRVFAGQRVLDIGCGAGVVSCLCASMGAASVVGVDASSEALGIARCIVDTNSLGSKVTLVHGLDHTSAHDRGKGTSACSVDVVVGGGLLMDLRYGDALIELLSARQHLRPGGQVVPNSCILCMCAADYSAEAALTTEGDCWHQRQQSLGLDLSALGACALPQLAGRCRAPVKFGDALPVALEAVPELRLSSVEAQKILHLSMSTSEVSDALPSALPFRVPLRPDRCTSAIVLYLDALLVGPEQGQVESGEPVIASTAPRPEEDAVGTCAVRQMVLHLSAPGPPLRPLCLHGSSFEALEGTLSISRQGPELLAEIEFTAVARGGQGGGFRAGGKYSLPA